jgi:hypothetical protein
MPHPRSHNVDVILFGMALGLRNKTTRNTFARQMNVAEEFSLISIIETNFDKDRFPLISISKMAIILAL